MFMDGLWSTLFIIIFCIVLIWLTGTTISEFKEGRATVTQIFQAILLDFVYFSLFFMTLISPDSSAAWSIIAFIVCMVFYIISERVGDWMGWIYRNAIKPYMKLYTICGIICFSAIVIGSYVLAYMTWKGVTRPRFLVSALASALIAVIGFIVDMFGYANGVWRLFIRDRGEEEKKFVTVASFFLVWILIGMVIGLFFHLSAIKCAVFGIIVLMYFMIPAWVGHYPGIIIGFLPSAIHIVSLISVSALIIPLIAM